jgi:hypothetical protein
VDGAQASTFPSTRARFPAGCRRVVYRKITNGFRSEWGATLYTNIRSVVETARRCAVRAFEVIRLTLKGEYIAIPDLRTPAAGG